MCGRYVSVRSDSDLLDEFDAEDGIRGETVEPDYNVAPTKPVRAVVNRQRRDESGKASGAPVRQLRLMTWGLVPSWAKDPKIGNRMFNARVESVATKPAFRRAYAMRRCLVPADGWYEWQSGDRLGRPGKQAFYMTPGDGHVLAFAGLYEFWGESGSLLTTCTIITVPAAGQLTEIHDRMPLVLPRKSWQRWLDPKISDPKELLTSWDEAGGEHLELRPVSRTVNSADNNGPELIERVEEPVEPQVLF